ncbi:hypothetical protein BJX70DRAFT_402694 [Aspergillus crustosus]
MLVPVTVTAQTQVAFPAAQLPAIPAVTSQPTPLIANRARFTEFSVSVITIKSDPGPEAKLDVEVPDCDSDASAETACSDTIYDSAAEHQVREGRQGHIMAVQHSVQLQQELLGAVAVDYQSWFATEQEGN